MAVQIEAPAWVVIDSPLALLDVVASYLDNPAEPVYFDTETTGLDPHEDKLVAVLLKQAGMPSVIVDVRRMDASARAGLQTILTHTPLLVGHNLKFDVSFLQAQLGVGVGRIFDTMIAEQLILGGAGSVDDAGSDVSVDLKTVAKRYGVREVSKEGRSWFIDLHTRPDEWDAPFPVEQLAYMAQDVDVLFAIHQAQAKLLRERRLEEVFEIEMRVLPVLAQMELHGITIDADGWRAFMAEKAIEAREHENRALEVFGAAILSSRITRYDEELAAWHAAKGAEEAFIEQAKADYEAGWADPTQKWGDYKQARLADYRSEHPMPPKPALDTSPPNIGSGAQLVEAFRVLGIPVPTKRNEKGEVKPTTETAALETLAKTHPEVQPLIDHRKAQKFVDSFGENLLSKGKPTGLTLDDGHTLLGIHPDYLQARAATGRMACRNPNWQQIPARGDGKRLRKLVRARPGYKLLTADFSNMELRILASLVGPGVMYAALKEGKDLHAETARMMFDLGPGVDPAVAEFKPGTTYRAIAKVINFGLVYGMSAFKLSRDLKVTLDQAEDMLARYFALYPEVKKWLDQRAVEVHRTLSSRTVAGRMRLYHAPKAPTRPSGKGADWAAYNEALRAEKKQWGAIERQAKNTPIQGSSADITKLALALIGDRLEPEAGVPVAVVHDEIVVEAPDELADYAATVIGWAMEDAFKTYIDPALVPETEVKIADYWSK